MRRLAAHAASDRAFLSVLRKDPRAALAAHGYDLTEELGAVLDLRRRTAALGDGMVAALLAGGLKGGSGNPQPPGRPAHDPSRPGRPGGRRRRPEG